MTYSGAALLLVALGLTVPCQADPVDQSRVTTTTPHASPKPGKAKAMTVNVNSRLNRIRQMNKGYPAVLAAIDKAALEIKAHPQEFVGPDGSVNMEKVSREIQRHMQSQGSVALPDSGTSKDGER
jgi:hypothetical protein